MKFFIFCSVLFFCSFPLYSSPISLGATLVLASFSFVSLMAFMSSWWYSYILFLVYVGGLLVMFIYVCLISSNFSLHISFHYVSLILFSFMVSYFCSFKPLSSNFMGFSGYDTSNQLIFSGNLWVFCSLVVLLLLALLIIVRSSGSSAVSIK